MTDSIKTRIQRTAAVCGILALAAVAASCKTTGGAPPGPPNFQAGYSDGCDSGYGDAGRRGMEDVFVKDEAKFDSDPQYKDGWQQGYATCYQSEENQPMMGQR